MADLGHDRIGLIGAALPETARMNMDVGNDGAPGLPAVRPEIAKPTAIDLDDAGFQRVGIDVVVKDELLDPPHLAVGAEKKRAALAPPTGAPLKFRDASTPSRGITENFRWRSEDAARERCY